MNGLPNIKVAVVGCGYWGKNLVRNFHEIGALSAVCDYSLSLAQKMSDTYKVPILSFEQVMADNSIDAVVIAAPAEQHFELAKSALENGKHVFVEKPLALKTDDAEKLCEIAKDKQLTLMVGHLLQYHPVFLKLKEMLSQGDLGKIQYIYSNRLNLGKIRSEENILWSFAPHDISMILGLVCDEPTSIYATGSCHLNPHIHDVTTTHLTFKNGVEAHVFVSWLHPFKEQKLVVVGDSGMAVFDDGLSWDQKLCIYPHKIGWVNGHPTPEKAEKLYVPIEESEPLKLECQHFIDCIKGKTPSRTNGEEGLRVLRVLDASQESLNTQKTIYAGKLAAKKREYFSHESSVIDAGSKIGGGTKIWHFSHIMGESKIGKNCVIGQNVMVGPGVDIGDNCKIQNNVSLYKGVTLADGVFCGPSCVFTNVNNPRAEIEKKDEFRPTLVEKGVTIGANATIICGVTLGSYSFIGAGSVVTKNVPPHALMVGNPAKQVGWMSHAGEKLSDDLVCPNSGEGYQISSKGKLVSAPKN